MSLESIDTIGGFGSANGQFRGPAGIAVSNQAIWVNDQQNQRIERFTKKGIFEFSFKQIKNDEGDWDKMDTPYAIAIDLQGMVYVSDSEAGCLYQFDNLGQYQQTIGSFGVSGVKFNAPKGIYVDNLGFIYIADSGNNRILKIDAAAAKALEIPQSEGSLKKPADIYVDPEGAIYVLDEDGIKLFNELGKYQKMLVKTGDGTITAFTLDSQKHIYTIFKKANSHNEGNIIIFDYFGNEMYRDDLVTINAQMVTSAKKPMDLVVDDGKLYVTDQETNKVIIYGIRN
jgi:DNA-binding beta-propeller fold protein YncE